MVFNVAMNDKELILFHGGPTKLARTLGYPEKGGAQVVHNWMRRGIPAKVKVEHPEMFLLNLPQTIPPPEKDASKSRHRRRATDRAP